MIEVTTLQTQPAGTDLQQKLKSNFTADQGYTLYMEYNGAQSSFRVQHGTVQRLFFFEGQTFQKTVFHNEYGVQLGQLVPTKSARGWLRIDGKKYRFAFDSDAAQLSLFHARSKHPLLTCSFNSELLSLSLDAQHTQYFLYCLAFAFAWVLA